MVSDWSVLGARRSSSRSKLYVFRRRSRESQRYVNEQRGRSYAGPIYGYGSSTVELLLTPNLALGDTLGRRWLWVRGLAGKV